MSSTTPLTILISVFNGTKTLDRTFESLQKQTFQNFSILCIDDASQDESVALLQKWQQHFGVERFFLHRNDTNLGLTHSLNFGLEKITTPLTARLDADDWWHPTKLQKQLDYLKAHPECGLVGTWYQNHGKHGIKSIPLPVSSIEIKQSIFKRNPLAHSAVMFRTALVQKLGSYNAAWRYGQDYELWLRLLPHTELANLPEYLCYRTADDTLTARKQREQMLTCVKTQLLYLKKYNRPWLDYRFIFEPLLVALTPEWLRRLKRHFL